MQHFISFDTVLMAAVFIASSWQFFFRDRYVSYWGLRMALCGAVCYPVYSEGFINLTEKVFETVEEKADLSFGDHRDLILMGMEVLVISVTFPIVVKLYGYIVDSDRDLQVLAAYSSFAVIVNFSEHFIRIEGVPVNLGFVISMVVWFTLSAKDLDILRSHPDPSPYIRSTYVKLTLYGVTFTSLLFEIGLSIYLSGHRMQDGFLFNFLFMASIFLLVICFLFAKATFQSIVNAVIREDIQKEKDEVARKLSESQENVILSFAEIMERKSGETGNHVKRVAEYTAIIAEGMGLPPERVASIRLASMMHDIGKVLIPNEILEKPGKLTAEEWETMQKHVTYGKDILSTAPGDVMVDARVIAEQHHERYDGNGYMRHLKADQIAVQAQIVAVADVYDALTAERSYKKPWPSDEAKAEILSQRGRQFGPKVVDAFEREYDRIHRVEVELANANESNETNREVIDGVIRAAVADKEKAQYINTDINKGKNDEEPAERRKPVETVVASEGVRPVKGKNRDVSAAAAMARLKAQSK